MLREKSFLCYKKKTNFFNAQPLDSFTDKMWTDPMYLSQVLGERY